MHRVRVRARPQATSLRCMPSETKPSHRRSYLAWLASNAILGSTLWRGCRCGRSMAWPTVSAMAALLARSCFTISPKRRGLFVIVFWPPWGVVLELIAALMLAIVWLSWGGFGHDPLR